MEVMFCRTIHSKRYYQKVSDIPNATNGYIDDKISAVFRKIKELFCCFESGSSDIISSPFQKRICSSKNVITYFKILQNAHTVIVKSKDYRNTSNTIKSEVLKNIEHVKKIVRAN